MKTVLEDMDIFEMDGLLYLCYGKVDYRIFQRLRKKINRIKRKQNKSKGGFKNEEV